MPKSLSKNEDKNKEANSKDIVKIMDLFYNDLHRPFEHLHNSFSQYIKECVLKEPELNDNIFFETEHEGKKYTYKFEMTNVRLEAPYDNLDNNKNNVLFPQDCRKKLKSYISHVYADVKQIQTIENIETKVKETRINYDNKNIHVASTPIMVKSPYCNTNLRKDIPNNECIYNPGGYFIIKGAEKIVIPQEIDITNNIIIKTKKDKIGKNTVTLYEAQIYSKKADNIRAPAQLIRISLNKEGILVFNMNSHFEDIPVCVLLKALGMTSDKTIESFITQKNNQDNMSQIVFDSLKDCAEISWFSILDIEKKQEIRGVKSKDDALNFLARKLNGTFRNTSSFEIEDIFLEKMARLDKVLRENLFPHISSKNFDEKARFITLACNKLLSCYLGYIEPDNRDAAINKRVSNIGELKTPLFRQGWRKMFSNITKTYRKITNHENPPNAIPKIDPSTTEQYLVTNLSAGTWGNSGNTGVAQSNQRLTSLQFLSSIKRFTSSKSGNGAGKIDKIRFPNGQYYGFYDVMETPEHGENVGLVKHLCLPATISINSIYQPEIIKEIINDELYYNENIIMINVLDCPPEYFSFWTKVFINGEWICMTKTPIEFTNFLKDKRTYGFIEKTVSISHNFNIKEIKIFTEPGRLLRPVLRVKDNKLLLKQYMLDNIDIKGKDPLKIHTWEDFLLTYPEVIDIIDPEEQNTLLIAFNTKDLTEAYERQGKIIENPNPFGDTYNRYNETIYKKYTHCEIDPSNVMGIVLANTIMPEMSDAARNYFAFSQIKQGIGIPFSDVRHIVELSYCAFNPEIPIVSSRVAKYTNTMSLPIGENSTVAISMYTGYNQEDSIVANRGSIERGMHHCESYKKEVSEISKNESAKNDYFGKPDPNIVKIKPDKNYSKLNSKGYVPEGTPVSNNDVILGKIRPNNKEKDNNSKNKDNDVSTVYNSNVKGVINKVFYNIKRYDGILATIIGIRQHRPPVSGDKFCSRNGQKGTIGIVLNTEDMPYTSDGIRPDLIINSCCMPTRRTASQIVDCCLSKIAAFSGMTMQIDSFFKKNIEEISEYLGNFKKIMTKTKLNESGLFNAYQYGCEKLYCGITGEELGNVFMGPTYYLRLKHFVNEKVHSRARGAVTAATRQPPEGRQKKGGSKLGEMERDCFIGYGSALSLREKHMDLSDGYSVHICTSCGLIAQKEQNKDVYFCKSCSILKPNITSYTVKIAFPYAAKVLFMSLLALGIVPRIRVENNEYNISL